MRGGRPRKGMEGAYLCWLILRLNGLTSAHAATAVLSDPQGVARGLAAVMRRERYSSERPEVLITPRAIQGRQTA